MRHNITRVVNPELKEHACCQLPLTFVLLHMREILCDSAEIKLVFLLHAQEIDMASACMILRRGIATSFVCHGKRNFRKFLLYNKRGSRQFKQAQAKNPDPDVPIDKRGVRDVGRQVNDEFVVIPEMIPELIVPSLEGFTLKPYVSYKVEEIDQGEFTAQDLFDIVYAKKIEEDFANGQLNENGEPLNPSEYEQLTSQQAKDNADKTGCDLFSDNYNPRL